MSATLHLSKNFRNVYFGGNWTASNLKEHLADLTWQEATSQVYSFNTIATLVYHIHYYVRAVTKVLEGGPLIAKDSLSFSHPPIHSEEDWSIFLDNVWEEAEIFAKLIAQLPESQLWENISEEKYGNFFRNLHGIVEHTHYHLGQIVLIKKILLQKNKN